MAPMAQAILATP